MYRVDKSVLQVLNNLRSELGSGKVVNNKGTPVLRVDNVGNIVYFADTKKFRIFQRMDFTSSAAVKHHIKKCKKVKK